LTGRKTKKAKEKESLVKRKDRETTMKHASLVKGGVDAQKTHPFTTPNRKCNDRKTDPIQTRHLANEWNTPRRKQEGGNTRFRIKSG